MKDLILERKYARGDKGQKVRLIQEWLSLNGFGVAPDRDFGPATETAVRDFQTRKKLPVDGEVGKPTFDALVAPMRSVLVKHSPKQTLGATVVAYAKRHLKAHPREVGGQNLGPWVRLYMGGREGAQFPWCAGFACFILNQACSAMQVAMPIKSSVSCDSLAASAKLRKLFLSESSVEVGALQPGALFLNRRTPDDWTHVGIVSDVLNESIRTIEGNTNDEGSREGYEVCARTRGYKKKDFVVV